MTQHTSQHPLVGRAFLSVTDAGAVTWQGTVIAAAENGVLVQLYEWLTGSAHAQRWCSWSTVETWRFYDTTDEMRLAFEALRPRAEALALADAPR